MSQTIMSLYRSARPNVRADWRIDTAVGAIPPGLVVDAAADPFGDERMSDQLDARRPVHATDVLQWFRASL